ncbi:patatin-like protein [Kitasatospora aureofaciens]|uniref:patatin-like protein n=1 Tax=Kitasatospora aureofaciens TaxID=1894 RepID=UPI0037F1AAD9
MTDVDDAWSQARAPEEVRLALVMNGGVSLAVWMGGVTHEIDLLHRASLAGTTGDRSAPRESEGPGQEVYELWRQIAAESNRRVVVDIISGTSAGGLNGMLLGTALGRGSALPPLRAVWEEAASLPALLRDEPKGSLLSGDFFSRRIRDELIKIGDGQEGPEQPVTLFLTATSLGGRTRSFVDEFGSRFEVRDHRRVYRFQYDKYAEIYRFQNGRWDFMPDVRHDFAPNNSESLALAAQASAGFPVAFPPVIETKLMKHRHQPDIQFDSVPTCVIDGGVLNNAPFGPVLDAISQRQVDAVVRRAVVYVVPSSGETAGTPNGSSAGCDQVSFVSTARSALEFPREVDFRIGTQDLATQLGNSVRDTQLVLFERMQKEERERQPNKQTLGDHVRDAAVRLVDEYRLSRAAAVLFEVHRTLAEAGETTALVPTQQADPKVLGAILGRVQI